MELALRGAPFSADDLAGAPDDGRRYELIDGALIVTPASNRRHQRALLRLAILLEAACPADVEVLVAPFDYRRSAATVVQPDLIVARSADIGDERLEVAPLLVAEVLSPSTRRIDLGTKRLVYEAAGVPAYWIVDPEGPQVTVLELHGDRYVERARVSGEERYVATRPFPLTVVPGDLLRR